jgi:hypothetical protein
MTIHVAGEVMRVRGLIRQRCAWCGEALIDTTEASLQVNPSPVPLDAEVPSTWPLWPPGEMVLVRGNGEAELWPADGSSEPLVDSCLDL